MCPEAQAPGGTFLGSGPTAVMSTPSGHVFRFEGKRRPVWRAKYRLPHGRQIQKTLGPAWTYRGRPPAGYFTKRTAEAWLRKTLVEAAAGTLPRMVRTGATVADACAEYLRYIEQDRQRKPSTLRDYDSIFRTHAGADRAGARQPCCRAGQRRAPGWPTSSTPPSSMPTSRTSLGSPRFTHGTCPTRRRARSATAHVRLPHDLLVSIEAVAVRPDPALDEGRRAWASSTTGRDDHLSPLTGGLPERSTITAATSSHSSHVAPRPPADQPVTVDLVRNRAVDALDDRHARDADAGGARLGRRRGVGFAVAAQVDHRTARRSAQRPRWRGPSAPRRERCRCSRTDLPRPSPASSCGR